MTFRLAYNACAQEGLNGVVFNGKLYFAATDSNGKELWSTDGTPAGTTMVKDFRPGTQLCETYDTCTVVPGVTNPCTCTGATGDTKVSSGNPVRAERSPVVAIGLFEPYSNRARHRRAIPPKSRPLSATFHPAHTVSV